MNKALNSSTRLRELTWQPCPGKALHFDHRWKNTAFLALKLWKALLYIKGWLQWFFPAKPYTTFVVLRSFTGTTEASQRRRWRRTAASGDRQHPKRLWSHPKLLCQRLVCQKVRVELRRYKYWNSNCIHFTRAVKVQRVSIRTDPLPRKRSVTYRKCNKLLF